MSFSKRRVIVDTMRILLSNDDGIHAPGISALYDAVRDLGEVQVVAPEAESSAVGHAITISDPLKIKKVNKNGEFFGYAVDGTPADCVKLAVSALFDAPPDIVLSGINLGPNSGINVLYSGTVSAATEGTILGIPSMAVSLNTFTDPYWETAGRIARECALRLIDEHLPDDTLLNVNVPNLPYEQIKGFRVTRMGRSRFATIFHRRTNPRGKEYYWMDGEMKIFDDDANTDLRTLAEGYVSLTPLWFDLTHQEAIPKLEKWTDTLRQPGTGKGGLNRPATP